MAQPRKHADLIKAWADGAEIEFYSEISQSWEYCKDPTWRGDREYRVKPKPKVKKWLWVAKHRVTSRYSAISGNHFANNIEYHEWAKSPDFQWDLYQKIDGTEIEVDE